jgi:P22 coat protein - gene protein 5
MANTYITPDIIARGMLAVIHNACPLLMHVDKQYDDSFGEGAMVNGNLPGPSIRIRKPVRSTVSYGAALDVQDTAETSITLTQSTRLQISRVFTAQDLTLTVADFKRRYIMPDGKRLASEVERQLSNLYLGTYNSVGTPGISPADDQPYLQANAKLNNYSVDLNNRIACITPEAHTSTVHGLTTLFNKQEKIGKQYSEGLMGADTLGMDFYLDQNLQFFTTGTRGQTDSTVVSNQSGATLTVATNDASTAFVYKQGDVFTVDGLYQVNYETHTATNNLQQFVVTADTTAVGNVATLPISPSIITSGSTQTTYSSSGNQAPSGAVCRFTGAASTIYPQNLIVGKQWATLASAPLYMPDGVDFKARAEQDGISIRVVRAYQINSDTLPTRMDILLGTTLLYEFAGCRLWG